MSNIKFNGEPAEVSGTIPKAGDKIEDFTVVNQDLSEASLSDFDGKKKVLIVLPSLDTGVCQKETKEFNEKLANMDDAVGLVISKDLPFTLKRFCGAEGIDNVIPVSDFRYNDFANQTGVELVNTPFKGLFYRFVFVLNKNNEVTYTEAVADISHEPNYDAALEALQSA
jgi:thiol peroxidase